MAVVLAADQRSELPPPPHFFPESSSAARRLEADASRVLTWNVLSSTPVLS